MRLLSYQFICLQVRYQVATGRADNLLANLDNYLLGVCQDASVSADVSALVRGMVQPVVKFRATAQQALQSLQVLAPSNKAGGKGIAF